jgi:hypothetical protein
MSSGDAMSPARGARPLCELAIFAAAYLTYFGVRALTQGSVSQAVANADSIYHVERVAGVRWEDAAQAAVLGHDFVVRLANWIYIFGHWPLLLLAGALLLRYRPDQYYLLRNACLISGAVGLIIFALFPVAPPRLAGVGAIDTVTRYAGGYRTVLPASLVNEYAAMPSFHAGWNVLLGVIVFRASRAWSLRAFAVAMPVMMVLAVVVTANHFVLDVVAGTTIALVTLLILVRRGRSSAPPTLDRHGGRAHDRLAHRSGPTHERVRHRPPRGERPRATAAGAAARHRGRRG